jgi:large subunit ribosomal protein L4
MKLKVLNGKPEMQVSDAAFGREFNEALVHQVVTAYQAAGRAGTKAQKTRAEVRGGGRKPHAQKGTGQARAGSSREPHLGRRRPHLRGQAARFSPEGEPQDVPGRDALDALGAGAPGRLRVVEEDITLEAGKTRLLVNQLKDWELEDVLIVVEAVEEKLFLAARNLYKVEVLEVGKLNPVALVSHDKVLMTVAAVKLLEERLQ